MRLARVLKLLTPEPDPQPSFKLGDLLQAWLAVEDYEPHATPTSGRFPHEKPFGILCGRRFFHNMRRNVVPLNLVKDT